MCTQQVHSSTHALTSQRYGVWDSTHRSCTLGLTCGSGEMTINPGLNNESTNKYFSYLYVL
jgi:hypothetical protein